MPADCTSDPFGLATFLDSVKQMFAHTIHRTHQVVAAAAATAGDSLECTENVEQIIQELEEEESHWTEPETQALRSEAFDPFMGAQPAPVRVSSE